MEGFGFFCKTRRGFLVRRPKKEKKNGSGVGQNSYGTYIFHLFWFLFKKKKKKLKTKNEKGKYFSDFLKRARLWNMQKKIPSSGVGLLADASSRFFVSGPTDKKKEEKGKMGQGEKKREKDQEKKRNWFFVFFWCIKKGKKHFCFLSFSKIQTIFRAGSLFFFFCSFVSFSGIPYHVCLLVCESDLFCFIFIFPTRKNKIKIRHRNARSCEMKGWLERKQIGWSRTVKIWGMPRLETPKSGKWRPGSRVPILPLFFFPCSCAIHKRWNR